MMKSELSSKGFIVAMALVFAAFQPALAQRNLKDIPSPDPDIELKSFQVAEGFEVNLYASDPRIAKPIQMNFDSQGRLWIASSEVYPQIKPGQKATDKILVVEDRDGDGTAEKTTVFVDGLLIPTGVEPGDGGAYVANSTELVHFKDTDGDLKADETNVVLSGFGTEDTHHILHTLRWGPDGMLYFNQSIYIHSHVETPYGVRRLNAGGIWQFRPETLRLEVLARGWVNSWGHHFDQWGQSFVTDGAGGEGINYLVPGAAYVTAFGVKRILRGLNPGSPKYCGLEMVDGRHMPEDWRGSLVTNDFRGNRVVRFAVSDDGAGYAAREQPELIKTKHVAFRPIDVKMGPDGAIYIADWYNPIIQHGEVDFRDPRRDHVHGRIWRVTAKGRPLVERPKLVGASTEELFEHLKAPETWTRHHAKRVLKSRGSKVVPKLNKWVAGLDKKDARYEHHLLEALWTYQTVDSPSPALLTRLLNADEPRVRAAAVRVLQHWKDRVDNPVDLLAERIEDDFPRVRLEAVRVLASIPRPKSVELALRALDGDVDRFMDYALWLTARERKDDWLPLVESGKFDVIPNVHHLTFALKAVESPVVVPLMLDLLHSDKVADEQLNDAVQVVASLGQPNHLAAAFEFALGRESDNTMKIALLGGLATATRQRKVRPAGDLGRLSNLLTSNDRGVVASAVLCAGLWKLESTRPAITGLATSNSTDNVIRLAAIDGLSQLGGAASMKALAELTTERHPIGIRLRAAVGLLPLDAAAAAKQTVAILGSASADDDSTPAISAFIGRKNAAPTLAQALAGSKINEDVAKLALRTISSSGRNLPGLSDALRKAGGIKTGPKTLSPEAMQALVADINEQGNPAHGESIFRRKDLACLKCHAIAGAGGRVGPDLLSVGASAQVDYLVESLLDPNKKVKENYNTLVVQTLGGKVVSGVKVRQTDKDLIIRDAEDREVAVPLDDIDVQKNGASIMPAGLTDRLTKSELRDLVSFLSKLGKVGSDYAISNQVRVVRRWQTLQPTKDSYFRLRRTRFSTVTVDHPSLVWDSAYSTVRGVLPKPQMPIFRYRAGTPGTSFARFELAVSNPGKVELKINDVDGLLMWVGTEPVEPAESVVVDLAKGTQRITFSANADQRKSGLRVELGDVEGSEAQVQIVSGK